MDASTDTKNTLHRVVCIMTLTLLFLSGCGSQTASVARSTATPSLATLTVQTQIALEAAPYLANLGSDDWNTQHDAVAGMSQMGPRAVDVLAAQLSNPDAQVRNGAVQVLGNIEDTRVVDLLISALSDADKDVRYVAAQELGSFKDKKAVEPLITAMQQDADDGVRFSAALSLGQIGDKRAVDPLIAALKDSNDTVRLYAADSLSEIGGSKASKALLQINDLQTIALLHNFYIKNGGSKYQQLLIQALDQYGSMVMLDDYLNCKNSALRAAARSYAESHGYTIQSYPLY